MSIWSPDDIGTLATEAIEAKVAMDEQRVMDVLQKILVQGNRRDQLAFVLANIYMISHGVLPGVRVVMGPVQVRDDGRVSPSSEPAVAGQQLFADMLGDCLAGRYVLLRDRWLLAADVDSSGAVAASIASAAALVRRKRAELN